jgi:hypothetical protein
MATKKTGNGPKIVKMAKQEIEKVELTPEQLKLKEKFLEIDRKITILEETLTSILDENPDTIYAEEVINNMIGLSAITAANNLVCDYFGIDKINFNDFI